MSLGDYLPHGTAIVFIDELLKFEDGRIKTKSIIKEDNKFLAEGKFAMHKTIEMMAQSLGIYDSKMRELKGMKFGLGFLLGSRKFEIFKPFLKIKDEVVIEAACSIQDANSFGVYDCELYVNGELGARATLNVLSPDEEYVKRILDE